MTLCQGTQGVGHNSYMCCCYYCNVSLSCTVLSLVEDYFPCTNNFSTCTLGRDLSTSSVFFIPDAKYSPGVDSLSIGTGDHWKETPVVHPSVLHTSHGQKNTKTLGTQDSTVRGAHGRTSTVGALKTRHCQPFWLFFVGRPSSIPLNIWPKNAKICLSFG